MSSGVYRYYRPFVLEQGGVLDGLEIAYHTFGTLSAAKDNVVWVCHALTANSDVADWWPHTVEEGKFLDPSRFFVVCANILGSCYGSTGPLSIDPATGSPRFYKFPPLTIRDIVAAHRLLAEWLGIERIHALVGASVGGFQAVEWAVTEPERFSRVALIATAAKASPWTIAIDETQRMAIMADSTYGEPRPDAAAKGLAAARAIGLLTYRGPEGYNISQRDACDPEGEGNGAIGPHRACSYQQYQGEKLVRRFDAYSYVAILDSFDTHDVGRGRGGVERALQRLGGNGMEVMVVGLSTDLVFTPAEMEELARMIPDANYAVISSPFGHDGFLVEHGQLNDILLPFFS